MKKSISKVINKSVSSGEKILSNLSCQRKLSPDRIVKFITSEASKSNEKRGDAMTIEKFDRFVESIHDEQHTPKKIKLDDRSSDSLLETSVEINSSMCSNASPSPKKYTPIKLREDVNKTHLLGTKPNGSFTWLKKESIVVLEKSFLKYGPKLTDKRVGYLMAALSLSKSTIENWFKSRNERKHNQEEENREKILKDLGLGSLFSSFSKN